MRTTYCIALSLLLWLPLSNVQAQVKLSTSDQAFLETMEDTLATLAYTVLKDSVEAHRLGACREMIPRLVTALKTPNSFQYPFERLESVSIQYPRDSSFRVFTWQLYVNENEYRYYGAIQMNEPELKLFPLVDRSFTVQRPEQLELAPENWYGAVYYNIYQVKGGDTPHYLLFGFHGNELFRKRKLIEVLHFVDGEPAFGAPVFVDQKGETKKRIVREYAAEVGTRLNYDNSLGIIIFDHLLTMEGGHGEGPNHYPDGSYEGYKLQADGRWQHIEKVFDQVSDEAPRPAPILEGRSKDIFGRDRKGKN